MKLLPPALLTDEDDKFYAECASEGINLVDRVNGKPVQVYPYWIDRPRCGWKSPKDIDSQKE